MGQRSLARRSGIRWYLLAAPVDRAELEAMLERFRSATHQLVWDGQPVTCSVGAAPVTPSEPPDALYQAADRLLYEAKTQGRDRYVIGS